MSVKMSFKGAFLVDVENECFVVHYENGLKVVLPIYVKNRKGFEKISMEK